MPATRLMPETPDPALRDKTTAFEAPKANRLHPWPAQLLDLILIQLSNWRWSWRGMIITGTLAPLLSTIALGIISGKQDPQVLAYILTGNLVMTLMFENLNRVSSNFAFMRAMGTLNYFATLPIQRFSLILATVLAFLLLSLPALSVVLVMGALFLRLHLQPSPWLLLVVPMAAIPLAGIGALIGSRARSLEEANSLNLLVTFVLLGLGPVVIPPDRLPPFMLALGRLSPATYAAEALRQTLLGPVTWRLGLDLVVLALLSLGIFWLVGRTLDWRMQE